MESLFVFPPSQRDLQSNGFLPPPLFVCLSLGGVIVGGGRSLARPPPLLTLRSQIWDNSSNFVRWEKGGGGGRVAADMSLFAEGREDFFSDGHHKRSTGGEANWTMGWHDCYRCCCTRTAARKVLLKFASNKNLRDTARMCIFCTICILGIACTQLTCTVRVL